ncbi:MAG: hypothetical protein IJR85_04840 [Synergistaceae bacterium]|nr:hypothetical protein [Synergistaceae bacterium]
MPAYGINGTTLNLEHLVFKCNNAASWSADYVLAAGELGIELDTKKVKLGDGTTQWSELAYYSDPVVSGLVETLTGRVTTAEGTLTSLGTRMDTAEGNITSHGTRLDTAEGDIGALETRATAIEGVNTTQNGRLDALEAVTTISANPFSA